MPTGYFSFVLPATRKGNDLRVYQADDPLGWPVTATGPATYTAQIYSPWPQYTPLYNTTIYYAQGRGDTGQPWIMRDLTKGDETGGIGGSNDLSTWMPTASKDLNINLTRWSHNLSLKQPGQPLRTIHRGAMVGAAYWSNGMANFSTGRHFTATTTRIPEIAPFTIVDTTTNQEPDNPTDQQLKDWMISAPLADTDGDTLPDWYEDNVGTDKNKKDTGEDGMSDRWELEHDLQPTNSSDADGDADNDGYTNAYECQMGTNPNDPGSHPPGSKPPNPANTPEIPVFSYASIDLTEITGVKGTGGMALGDDGQVAFYEATGSTYTVAVWKPDGTFKTGTVPDNDQGEPISVVGINSSGMLAGNIMGPDENGERTISTAFTVEPDWSGGPAVFTYPFSDPHLFENCFVRFTDKPDCDSPGIEKIKHYSSTVLGISRCGKPWGTKTAFKVWSFPCAGSSGSSGGSGINYGSGSGPTVNRWIAWNQVFFNDNTGMPDVVGNNASNAAAFRMRYTPEDYLGSLMDVSFDGAIPYGQWMKAEPFPATDMGPAATTGGLGFSPSFAGPSIVRGRTNDGHHAVAAASATSGGPLLVASNTFPAQSRVPGAYTDYVKITGVIDNANGATLLAQADVWQPTKPGATTGSWGGALVKIKGSDLHIVQLKDGSAEQASAYSMLAGTIGSTAPAGTGQPAQAPPPNAGHMAALLPVNIKVGSFLNKATGKLITTASPVCVGEPISLSIIAGSPVTAYSWHVPGGIKNYNATPAAAHITPLSAADTSASSVTLYYPICPENGSYLVSCDVTLATGVTVTVTGSLAVVAPTVSVARSIRTPTVESVSGTRGIIRLGRNNTGLTGFNFAYTGFRMPSGFSQDKIEWWQKVSANVNGSGVNKTTTGLDTGLPYSSSSHDTDNPFSVVYPKYSPVTRSDSFTMYLMFKPAVPGSIFVPLKQWPAPGF